MVHTLPSELNSNQQNNRKILLKDSHYLKVLTVIKRLEIEYPEPIQRVLELIKETKNIKTRDLGSKSKMGGAKIRGILDFLINEGIIEEKVIKEEKADRPKRLYSLKEEYMSS